MTLNDEGLKTFGFFCHGVFVLFFANVKFITVPATSFIDDLSRISVSGLRDLFMGSKI